MSRPTPGAILEALREAVTIVEPGEVLAVRLAPGIRDEDLHFLREYAREVADGLGVAVLLLEGEEFARIKRGDGPVSS